MINSSPLNFQSPISAQYIALLSPAWLAYRRSWLLVIAR